jgi:hypothetical protein
MVASGFCLTVQSLFIKLIDSSPFVSRLVGLSSSAIAIPSQACGHFYCISHCIRHSGPLMSLTEPVLRYFSLGLYIAHRARELASLLICLKVKELLL